jgi:glycosyltransferase involved in cell wall biosynthesis
VTWGNRTTSEKAALLRPVWVAELDLAGPPQRLVAGAPAPGSALYSRGRVLVRLQGEPLGILSVELTGGEADVDRVLMAARASFGAAISSRLGPDWRAILVSSPPPVSAELSALAGLEARELPAVSVVIGTRNRPEHAVACVSRVLKQIYPAPVEVLVIDNAPSSPATRDAITSQFGSDGRVRYIHESQPGLSRARNIGLAQASHPITAFLSDDIQVDNLWLLAVVRGFRRDPAVRCVVGYCPPLHLDTEAQLVFEQTMAWGWRNGFEPVVLGPELAGDRLHPYRVGFAVGANMSFDTACLRGQGGFDETLGPGTIARGGEDLDAPVRVLLDGGRVACEPAALGWHADRYDDRSFAAHMYTYGLGLGAFLTSHLLDRHTRWQLLRRVPFGAGHLGRPAILPDSPSALDGVPVRLVYRLANMAGRLAGPVAVLRSRRAIRGRVLIAPDMHSEHDIQAVRQTATGGV